MLGDEAAQIGRRAQFFSYQLLVLGHANSRSAKLVKAGGEHITDKLQGVVCVFGKLGNLKNDCLTPAVGWKHPPARQSPATAFDKSVDIIPRTRKQIVVVAGPRELRGRVLPSSSRGHGAILR